MVDSGIRTRPQWLPNRGDTPYICVIKDTNDFADDFVRHGQNQEKGKKFRLLS